MTPPPDSLPKPGRGAFTLAEMIVAMAVFVLLMSLIGQLFNNAAAVTVTGNKHMDADAEARAVFDRMAIDFEQMIKRPDVDYFLKDNDPSNTQPGNDHIAFYSQGSGYYPATSGSAMQSPVSLVAYRINADPTPGNLSYNKLQRLGCGLTWNGASATAAPMLFSTSSSSSGANNTIHANWRSATDATTPDPNYELAGPQVFRLEYYYLIRGQTLSGTSFVSQLSAVPWDTRIKSIPGVTDHTSVNGLQDVAAIVVTIAVLDPKSAAIAPGQLATIAGQMADFSNTATPLPGDLEAQWQSVVNASTTIPRAMASAVRIYTRYFYLRTQL